MIHMLDDEDFRAQVVKVMSAKVWIKGIDAAADQIMDLVQKRTSQGRVPVEYLTDNYNKRAHPATVKALHRAGVFTVADLIAAGPDILLRTNIQRHRIAHLLKSIYGYDPERPPYPKRKLL